MARRPRVEYPGAIYHVTVRIVGEAWQPGDAVNPAACLFRDDRERGHFLEQLGQRVEDYSIRLYGYCLMLSHYHLYLETPLGNLGRFMHSLGTAYTVYGNLRRQRRGHMVGRYKAKLVENDGYHLSVSRYLHLNPVRVRKVARRSVEEQREYLNRYPWSSYGAYVGRDEVPEWLSCDPILALCARERTRRRGRYRRFVEGLLGKEDEELLDLMKNSTYGIGGEDFQQWVKGQMIERGRRSKNPEDVSLRREETILDPEHVLTVTAEALGADRSQFRERRRNSVLRGAAARMLCRYAGLTQRQAAGVLEIGTGAAAGRQMRRLKERLIADRSLRRKIAAIEKTLNDARNR